MRDNVSEYEAVATLARTRNFRAAAAELNMSPSALSHAISAVETRLGVRLFNRTTRSVSLTEAGESFVARIGPALAQIRDAVEAVNEHRDTPRGTLRLNMAVGAARQMMPLMLRYMARYPEMKLDLVTENRLIDIVGEGFDAGVRLWEFLPQSMVAIPLGDRQRMIVVGTPDYFTRHPVPETPMDLLAHNCIRMRLPSGKIYAWEFERRGEEMSLDVQGTLVLDEPGLMIEAARAGLGIGFLNDWNVTDDLASGRLVQVLKDWTPDYPGLCLYYPGRRNVTAGLRALVDLIKDERQRAP
jgi:DNA-binding transcriptional LysR family regulator